jgi:epoxyqueuosine reductase QueG
MTSFAAQQQTAGTPSHESQSTSSSEVSNRANGVDRIAQAGYSLGDLQREIAIQHEAREVEQYMRRYADSGCFSDRGAADRARLRMEELIRGRSPEYVAKLERERGLA